MADSSDSKTISHGPARELLVVADLSQADAVRDVLLHRFDVVHSFPPRLFIVAILADDQEAQLTDLPGVTHVTGPSDEASVPATNQGEALFIAAWIDRGRRSPGKERVHDGVAWDAPGLVPPDPPPGMDSGRTE